MNYLKKDVNEYDDIEKRLNFKSFVSTKASIENINKSRFNVNSTINSQNSYRNIISNNERLNTNSNNFWEDNDKVAKPYYININTNSKSKRNAHNNSEYNHEDGNISTLVQKMNNNNNKDIDYENYNKDSEEKELKNIINSDFSLNTKNKINHLLSLSNLTSEASRSNINNNNNNNNNINNLKVKNGGNKSKIKYIYQKNMLLNNDITDKKSRANIRCNSLYLKAKMKIEITKKIQEKANEIKLKKEMTECTFKPQINNNIKQIRLYEVVNKMNNNDNNNKNEDVDDDIGNEKINDNEEKYDSDNIEVEIYKRSTKHNLYDKYKNKTCNLTALKNKEVYIKKKIYNNNVNNNDLYDFCNNRLNIDIVFDKNKSVFNDKLTKKFINRYEKSRIMRIDANLNNSNHNDVHYVDNGNIGGLNRSMSSLTCTSNKNIRNKSQLTRFNNSSSMKNLFDNNTLGSKSINNFCRNSTLRSFQENLRKEFSQVEL